MGNENGQIDCPFLSAFIVIILRRRWNKDLHRKYQTDTCLSISADSHKPQLQSEQSAKTKIARVEMMESIFSLSDFPHRCKEVEEEPYKRREWQELL